MTSGLEGRCSIQLSYGGWVKKIIPKYFGLSRVTCQCALRLTDSGASNGRLGCVIHVPGDLQEAMRDGLLHRGSPRMAFLQAANGGLQHVY